MNMTLSDYEDSEREHVQPLDNRPRCLPCCLFTSDFFLENLDRNGLENGGGTNFSVAFLSQYNCAEPRQPTRITHVSPTPDERADISGRIYAKIGSHETRLLCLHPASFPQALTCHLLNHPINAHATKYTALSYTWGKAVFSARISCNGYDFPVTQNLFDALHFLRNEYEERLVWVDALCINQSDLNEKTFQIPNMYKIYAEADQTFVWLGRSNEKDLVMLRQLEAISCATENALSGCHQSLCADVIVQLHDWLAKFLQRSWFSRSWIRQEVAASRRCVVACGSLKIDFAHFELGIKRFLLLDLSLPRTTASMPIQTASAAVRFHRLLKHRDDLKDLFPMTGKNAPITTIVHDIPAYICRAWLKLILQGSIFAATDPRDKIFSMGGALDNALQSNNFQLIRNIHEEFKMSYTSTVSEVYQNFVKALINISRTLEALSFFRPSYRPNANLPTWAPNLRTPEGGCLAAGVAIDVGDAERQRLSPDFIPLHIKGTILGVIIRSIDEDPNIQNLSRVQLDDLQPLNLFQNEDPPIPQLDRLWQVGQPMNYILSGMGFGMFAVSPTAHAQTDLGLDCHPIIVQATLDAQPGDIIVCAYGAFHPFVLRQDSRFIMDNGIKFEQFCGPCIVWSQIISQATENTVAESSKRGITDNVAASVGFKRWRPPLNVMKERLLSCEQDFYLL